MSRFLFPEEPELLLHGMDGEKRLVDLKQSVESGLAVGCEIFIVAKQQETIPFKGLLPSLSSSFCCSLRRSSMASLMSAMMW